MLRNGELYLRIYIEKDGGITLSDCEALSRRVSDLMDEKDPIRSLLLRSIITRIKQNIITEEHYKRFIGREVMVKFTKSVDGKEKY